MKEKLSLSNQELHTRLVLIDIKDNFVDIKNDLLNKSIALKREQSTSIEAEQMLDGTFMEIIEDLDKQINMIDKAIKSREYSKVQFDKTFLIDLAKIIAVIFSF